MSRTGYVCRRCGFLLAIVVGERPHFVLFWSSPRFHQPSSVPEIVRICWRPLAGRKQEYCRQREHRRSVMHSKKTMLTGWGRSSRVSVSGTCLTVLPVVERPRSQSRWIRPSLLSLVRMLRHAGNLSWAVRYLAAVARRNFIQDCQQLLWPCYGQDFPRHFSICQSGCPITLSQTAAVSQFLDVDSGSKFFCHRVKR